MGIGNTVTVFAVTLFFAIPLGLVLSFISMSKIALFRAPVRAFVFVMRGTPLMLQLFFVCFGLPFLPYVGRYLVMDRFYAACLTFVLNYAAYFCEIFRGGLLSIDEVCERYNLTLEEFASWQRAVDRSGMQGLRVTRIQHYRDLYERQQKY